MTAGGTVAAVTVATGSVAGGCVTAACAGQPAAAWRGRACGAVHSEERDEEVRDGGHRGDEHHEGVIWAPRRGRRATQATFIERTFFKSMLTQLDSSQNE